MKNSALIKGTAAIAVGAALLLGGGGTLASWNAADNAAPGTVVAGDLNVVKSGAGVWTDRAGNPVTISTYKVVPGDKLTYTQVLDVTLTGNKMAANITAAGTGAANGFTAANVVVTDPVLKVAGVTVTNPLTTSKTVTATITFEFLSTTTGRADVTATYNFGNVAFTLEQIMQDGLA
ncbi:alternate-type signal peptide domain-containing protein [Arthrobacter sp. ISL-5]|uniref:alternate-type signal peptide domain-containing protein n=1 Tax=Arthrobacter sp. ISL-5 TaxID=2819111 RepID=UPI001BEA6621|nr:alternate-type signal peptide domain-containing protein [Arthrobacter sp. ISL-5]MBT2553639.1 alternate-type signal peptide domain-containing protein [Arthrobacter sp. ISL-5]